MHKNSTLTMLAVISVLLMSTALLARAVKPSPAERAALQALKGQVHGRIVWESNRTGVWELYTMDADGTGARQLTHLADPDNVRAFPGYLRPQFSPDGRFILFAYGKKGAPPETWVVPADGGEARKAGDGDPLNWASDSNGIYVVRDSTLWLLDLTSGQETRAHQATMPADGLDLGMVGTVRDDLKVAFLRTPEANELFMLDEGKTVRTTDGCEARLSADGSTIYWVQGPNDFRAIDLQTGEEHQMMGKPEVEPYNYTYFPTVSDDARWLLYGASPSQHDHDTSDYEVFIVPFENWRATGQPVRLTFNSRTDRWPNLSEVAPQLPDGPYDAADAEGPLMLATFTNGAEPWETSVNFGLWPQNEECKATATFVDGDDAEGGTGGSLKLDYSITGEPNSVALWFSSPDGPLDLSEYDRLVLYAKGSVPAFTIVAEDASAKGDGGASGAADFVVTGVTDEWQRIVCPLDKFKPREKGGKVDWRHVKVLAVALIPPASPKSGSLQLDNLVLRLGPG